MKTLGSKSFRIDTAVVTFYLMSNYSVTFLIDYDDNVIVSGSEVEESTALAARRHYDEHCNRYKAEMLLILQLDTDKRDKKTQARYEELNALCHGFKPT